MATPPKYGSRWPTYAVLWDKCETRPDRVHEVAAVAKRLLSNKARYQLVEKKTSVPWWVIAALHEREASGSFNAILAQGDPLSRISTHVPRGMGPYFGPDAWERAAIESLEHDKLDRVIDWRIEKALYWCEAWNGWGYYLFHPHTPSPYLWGASTVQKPGKYVADGVWSSTAMDKQLGVAVIFKALADLDLTIRFVRETPPGMDTVPVAANRPTVPAKQVPVTDRTEVADFHDPVAPSPQPGKLKRLWAWFNKTRDT